MNKYWFHKKAIYPAFFLLSCLSGNSTEQSHDIVVSSDSSFNASSFLPSLTKAYVNQTFYIAEGDSTGESPTNRTIKVISIETVKSPRTPLWYSLWTDNPKDTIKCSFRDDSDLWCPDLSSNRFKKNERWNWEYGPKFGLKSMHEIDSEETAKPLEIKKKEKSDALLRKKWGKRVFDAIKNGQVFVGMTKEQALMSWGEPTDINRTTNVDGTSEQWVYGDKSYLYFDGNILTTIQN